MSPFFDFHKNNEAEDLQMYYLFIGIDLVFRRFRIFDTSRIPWNKSMVELVDPLIANIKSLWQVGFKGHATLPNLNDFLIDFADVQQETDP